MKVILLITRKGGSGKTTLSKHFAVEFLKYMKNVAIVDLDPQGSLAKWSERRFEKGYTEPKLVNIDIDELKTGLKQLEDFGAEAVIIDCPGIFVKYLKKAIEVSDFAVIPTKPTNDDLEFANENVDLIESVQAINDKGCCKPFFVINEATAGDNFVDHAYRALAQLAPVLGVINRTNLFAKASLEGKVITELPASVQRQVKAVKQVKDIAKALRRHIKKG